MNFAISKDVLWKPSTLILRIKLQSTRYYNLDNHSLTVLSSLSFILFLSFSHLFCILIFLPSILFFYLTTSHISPLLPSCIYKFLLERRTGQLEYMQTTYEYLGYKISCWYFVSCIQYAPKVRVILILGIYEYLTHNLIFNMIVRAILALFPFEISCICLNYYAQPWRQ